MARIIDGATKEEVGKSEGKLRLKRRKRDLKISAKIKELENEGKSEDQSRSRIFILLGAHVSLSLLNHLFD